MDTSLFNFDYQIKNKDYTFVAKLPKGISQKQQLLSSLSNCLKFPDYFGMNWDALDDCLSDFNWISRKTIVLYHEDVPLMIAKEEQSTYLEILLHAVDTWKNSPKHEFIVSFPSAVKSYLNNFELIV